jgi:polar amino acid transport system substrate-binding protein
MKQVINRRGKVSVSEFPRPVCGRGEVIVGLTHSLISSGTESMTLKVTGQNLVSRAKERPDLVRKVVARAKEQGLGAAIEAVKSKLNEPKPMGYSATGLVLEVGSEVTRFAPGDRASCAGASAGHAEIVAVPENLVVAVPQEVSSVQGCFATLGSIALQGVRRARVEVGDNVLVLGLGLVGQLAAQFAKLAGGHVIGFDLEKDRAGLALELGADAAFSPPDRPLNEAAAEFTGGRGVDVVIVAAGTQSSEPINQAIALARERGRVAIVGMIGLDIEYMPYYEKELDVFISRSYGPGRYDKNYEERGQDYPASFVRWTENRNMEEVLRLIAGGRINVDRLISKVTPLDSAEQAYAALDDDRLRPLSIVLEYPDVAQREDPNPEITAHPPRRDTRTTTSVAVIGCGGFCKKERLPYFKKSTAFEFASFISGTAATVHGLAQQYGVRHCGTDYREVLAMEDVQLLVVATPNSLHGPIAIDAARAGAGKDILVEKPMAVDSDELEAVYEAVRESAIRYACAFNRRYAPASERLKDFVDARKDPAMITYRCNAGLIPRGHMMHPPEEGGGLIVGEACHFFDYCLWLTGARALSVSAAMLSYDGDRFVATDNMAAVVKFDDGSVASIIYSTMGSVQLSKERVEVFSGGACAVLDDFSSLTFHSAKMNNWAGRQDKGHKTLVKTIGEALCQGKEMPIGLEASYRAHALTFKALESMRTGQTVALPE